jgi:hypothetical protein
LIWKGVGPYTISGKTYGPLAAFLLDKETNSFSLSKFQLLTWTCVAVFGYMYLFLCRMLIQWDFTFPPIPDGLPTLLGISAGTTVAASGITITRGAKGAGPVQPSMADFVSSEGLLAADRFQFFVWTLICCAGFLGLLLQSDPSILKELPKIPDSFRRLHRRQARAQARPGDQASGSQPCYSASRRTLGSRHDGNWLAR